MTFSITLVHAPGALPEPVWEHVRGVAPGLHGHECRLVVHPAAARHAIAGPQLEKALRQFLRQTAQVTGSDLMLSTAGHELRTLEPGSAFLHAGMVVLLSPRDLMLAPVRRLPLSLCVDSGPDSGQLLPLRRGLHQIGRAQVDVPVADSQLSRHEAILEVGAHDVRLKASADDVGTPVSIEEGFQLGRTVCQLALGTPQVSPAQSWPPAEAPVEGRPPEGRHTMMVAFALVPLVAGVVLVLVTGLWFFLLFSGASALIAVSIFLHGQRQRRRYRRALQNASEVWGERAAQTLVSPGKAAQLLRGCEAVTISAAADEHPAVRLGLGIVEAQLETGTSSKPPQPQTVDTVAGIDLASGQVTALVGPRRERHRLQRWIMMQLALNPLRCDIVVPKESEGLNVAELRDIPRCHSVSLEKVPQLGPAQGEGCVLLATEPLPTSVVTHALKLGWHVLAPDVDEALTTTTEGWHVDLRERTVTRRRGSGLTRRDADELRMDGLSQTTFEELCRLATRHMSASARPAELPNRATCQLPATLFTESSATELLADLGPSLSGSEQLDLVGDGPHVLVAGTTGSGKSELLKTLLLSLCSRHSPKELTMVLIDFKGGATFQRLAKLEHVLGVVTDLSQAATERTLESIRSELVRREKLFLSADAGDYIEYRALSSQPLPRILVVIDEFRIFAHELPDQLDELMRLATLGRSLGLHLVLSTQRPQGVITADIRANIGAAIALRMRGEDESRDVIGTPIAAEIPRQLPGRALLRRPGEPPVELQTALLQAAEPKLCAAPEVDSAPSGPPESASSVVETVQQELTRHQLRRVHTPLLPPLPSTLRPNEALQDQRGALLGRVDDPGAQAQYDLRLNPLQPKALALIGEASAAAGQTCRAVTAQLLNCAEPSAVYLLDGDRSLTQLRDHGRVGAWLTEEHMTEATHLLDQLCAELADRRMGRGRTEQPLVLVLTGYSRWLAQSHMGLGIEQQLSTLAAEGPQAGISVILTGGRELAVGKLTGRFPQRIYLPYGSGDDVTYLWPKLRSAEPLAGRGVLISSSVASPGLTVQLVASEEPSTTPTTTTTVAAEPAPVIRVRTLPERLSTPELPQSQGPGVVVGVQQLNWAPATLELGPVNLILGSAGTGKSSCLRLLRHQIPKTAMVSPGDWHLETFPEVLLVDDAHRCTPQEHQLIQEAVTAGTSVVATAPASGAVFTQLPWAHPARIRGSNVILSPVSRSEAEAFAVTIPVLEQPVPGRAVHLRPEGALVTQWAFMPQE